MYRHDWWPPEHKVFCLSSDGEDGRIIEYLNENTEYARKLKIESAKEHVGYGVHSDGMHIRSVTKPPPDESGVGSSRSDALDDVYDVLVVLSHESASRRQNASSIDTLVPNTNRNP